MTIKAILDTNVLISGIFWKGAPFQVLKAWQGRRFRLAISLPILDEYSRALEEMTRKRPSAVLGSILALIELQSSKRGNRLGCYGVEEDAKCDGIESRTFTHDDEHEFAPVDGSSSAARSSHTSVRSCIKFSCLNFALYSPMLWPAATGSEATRCAQC